MGRNGKAFASLDGCIINVIQETFDMVKRSQSEHKEKFIWEFEIFLDKKCIFETLKNFFWKRVFYKVARNKISQWNETSLIKFDS